ncbi:hypothetical protein [Streptomyces longwoodensis]|uniref:hypothetical protein n=1 Tax=Streptomyces longwoodensis TaxID=68231 RepID=UPI003AF3728E
MIRTDGPPPLTSIAVPMPSPLEEGGRGLALVAALADRWEVVDREPPPGRAVRAEADLRGGADR